jgi:hypothetical protein
VLIAQHGMQTLLSGDPLTKSHKTPKSSETRAGTVRSDAWGDDTRRRRRRVYDVAVGKLGNEGAHPEAPRLGGARRRESS